MERRGMEEKGERTDRKPEKPVSWILARRRRVIATGSTGGRSEKNMTERDQDARRKR